MSSGLPTRPGLERLTFPGSDYYLKSNINDFCSRPRRARPDTVLTQHLSQKGFFPSTPCVLVVVYVPRTGRTLSAPKVGDRVSGFEFQVSGFGFRVWGLGFGVSDFGFQVSGLGFGVWGFGFRVLCFGLRISRSSARSASRLSSTNHAESPHQIRASNRKPGN